MEPASEVVLREPEYAWPVRFDQAGLMRVIDPESGEVTLIVNASDSALLQAHAALAEIGRLLWIMRLDLEDELRERMDRQRKWTIHAGGHTASAPSPAPEVEYDHEQLVRLLRNAVRRGEITRGAMDAAVERVPASWKVSKQGLTAILRGGGKVARQIAMIAQMKPKTTRKVTVKPR